jgi:hypothetical protein
MAKKDDSRRSRDAAGIGPYARERGQLVPLSQMRGWNVLDGEADIRSWEVKTVSGKVLGQVRELLIDPKAGEVVLIDVDLAGSDRHAYLPIRVAEIDRARRVVRADSADLEDHEAGADVRLSSEELSRVRKEARYADRPGERVVDRKPVVEETVVRRRSVDETDTRL